MSCPVRAGWFAAVAWDNVLSTPPPSAHGPTRPTLMSVHWRRRIGGSRPRLTGYDRMCGREIERAFAGFEGLDPRPALREVFAQLVHDRTGGFDDGTANPLGVRGAGWAGFAGYRDVEHGPDEAVACFVDLPDGCRAAAVMLHGPEHPGVQSAYRAGDPRRLAEALASLRPAPDRTQVSVDRAQGESTSIAHRAARHLLVRWRAARSRAVSPVRD